MIDRLAGRTPLIISASLNVVTPSFHTSTLYGKRRSVAHQFPGLKLVMRGLEGVIFFFSFWLFGRIRKRQWRRWMVKKRL